MKLKLKYRFLLFLFILFNISKAQVVADFTADNFTGCSPLTINFMDLSTSIPNPITSWSWDFGNGNSSTQQNPGSIYITPGTYPVCLTVTDGTTSDTFCDTVIVYNDPVINFIADDSVGCANLAVNFTNLSVTGTGIASALWNFGDGTSSSSINASHTFSPGIFTITLIVTDSSGCITQGDKIQYINSISNPIADFTAINTQNCSVPTIVTFTNTSSFDAGASYTWNFGDSSPNSNLEDPNHSYSSAGSYDVQLIVDKNGCIDSITKPNFVVMQSQNADFTSTSINACVGENIDFTDISVLAADSWSWDFGEGTGSILQNPSYAYLNPGVFTVSMTSFLVGCDDTEIKNNYITINPSSIASFTSNKQDTCGAPFTVNFTSSAIAGSTYSWDFGDLGTSTDANPSYTYNSLGSFDVSLTVTSPLGCTTIVDSLSFINILGPTANFELDDSAGCVPTTFQATDLSTSSNPIVNWIWDFSDGPLVSGTNNPSYTYTDTGTFNISLIAIDNLGCSDTSSIWPFRVGRPISVNFSANPLTTCRINPIQFTNLTDTSSIDDINWHWYFGDTGENEGTASPLYQYSADTGYMNVTLILDNNGCQSDTTIDSIVRIFPPIAIFGVIYDCVDNMNVLLQDSSIGAETWVWKIDGDSINNTQNVNYTFSDTGTFEIILVVENLTYGCIDSAWQEITIVDPTVNFSLDDSLGCLPLSVNFIDSSQGALSWFWDFGDGNTSTSQNPMHTYTTSGIYDVYLEIVSLNGCADTLLKQNAVTVLSSIAEFTSNDTVGCRPSNVNFMDLSISSVGNITSWIWDFGDGFTSLDPNPSHTYSDVGTFDVTLSVTDSLGCTSTIVKDSFIRSTGPLPNFTNNHLICNNDTIFFNSTSVSDGGTINSWHWDFGDGDTSILENPYHVYAAYGNYDVSLTIVDDNGCDSTYTVPNTVFADSMLVEFTADSTSGNCTGFIVNFEQLVSPNPVSWLWDFGDGSQSTVSDPSVVFSSVNSFDITLIATNSSGCIDTIVKPDFITINGPQGTLSNSSDIGCIDFDVDFNIVSANSVTQSWDLGDGTVVNNILSYTHTYNTVGIFHPLVVLEDAAGCSVTYYFDSIQTGSLDADLYIDTNYICTPSIINFADSSSSSSPVLTWDWDFGDGNSSNIQNTNHNYTNGGVFDVELIVSNFYCSDTVNVSQYIVSDSSTLSNFNTLPQAVICPPVEILFSETSTSDSLIASWNWDFGNGQTEIIQNPTNIVYDTSGVFLITLDVVSTKGCISHFEDSITINTIPIFNLNLDTIELCQFEDTIIDALHPTASFTWTPVNNLSCSDCPNPTITANNTTIYNIQAITDLGCIYEDTLTFVVHDLPDITVTDDKKVKIGTSLNLYAFSTIGSTDFNWSPSINLNCNNCSDNIFVANESTNFTISIEDQYNCINYDTIKIEVFDLCDGSSIFLPNIFTPNNDGKNDIFKATILQNLIPDINFFRIFDRWGKLVFESNNIKEGWDGIDKNGEFLNNGVYVYVLDVICSDGSHLQLNGNVAIVK